MHNSSTFRPEIKAVKLEKNSRVFRVIKHLLHFVLKKEKGIHNKR